MNHHDLAAIAAAAYDNKTFSIHECECLIKWVDGVQIVAFCGTEISHFISGSGWLDVIRDARLLPWYDHDTGWVHAGFLKGGRLAAEFLTSILRKDWPVICTGHSLGGALGLICALKLQKQGFDVVEWVGFGSPKAQIGGRRYTGFKRTNYRHGADIVPLLPELPFYRHNYRTLQIGKWPDGPPSVQDHDVKNYFDNIDIVFDDLANC